MSSCQGAGWSCECALWPGLEVYLLRTANERGWWFWLSNKCSKFWRSSSGSSNRQIDQCRHVTSRTKTSMSIIAKPQGFSINRCLRSLPVPCLPRGLFLHQEEWVFFLFLNKWYQGLAHLFFYPRASVKAAGKIRRDAQISNYGKSTEHGTACEKNCFVHLLNISSHTFPLLLSSTRQCSDKRTRAWLRFRAATRWTPVLDNQLLKYD